MLLNPSLKKKITIKYINAGITSEYVCQPMAGMVPFIDKQTDKYTCEAVTLWPVAQKQTS